MSPRREAVREAEERPLPVPFTGSRGYSTLACVRASHSKLPIWTNGSKDGVSRVCGPRRTAWRPTRGTPGASSTSVAEGLVRDVEEDAVVGAPAGVRLVDLSDEFCDNKRCYAVVGNVIVYRDYSHLSKEYSTLLAPYLGRAIDNARSPTGRSAR